MSCIFLGNTRRKSDDRDEGRRRTEEREEAAKNVEEIDEKNDAAEDVDAEKVIKADLVSQLSELSGQLSNSDLSEADLISILQKGIAEGCPTAPPALRTPGGGPFPPRRTCPGPPPTS